jgi:hypothetical protein
MLRFFKELYFTVFTLGYKFNFAGGWKRINSRFGVIMDQGKGVFLVSIIMFFVLFGIKQCVEIHLGKKLAFDDTLWELLAVLAIYYVNLYILVTRGYGVKFEREFNNFTKSKKIILITTCSVLMFGVMAFCLYGRDSYLHLPKN